MSIVIAIATFFSTLLGGIFALKFKDRLHLILGFSAGAVIGVAFFDLIPEAIELGRETMSISKTTSLVALGFIIYLILDRFFVLHTHAELEDDVHESSFHRGNLGAASFITHSFFDGVAIGLAFQVSESVGLIIATAVLVHDFSDGINTVNVILKNNGRRTEAIRWLFAGACAPVLGVISTLFFSLPEAALGIILALFSGFFLYIGASDLLPESHHKHPTKWTTIATIIGIIVLYTAIQLAKV